MLRDEMKKHAEALKEKVKDEEGKKILERAQNLTDKAVENDNPDALKEIKEILERIENHDLVNLGESLVGIAESVANVSESVANVSESVANVSESVANVSESVANVSESVANVADIGANVGRNVRTLYETLNKRLDYIESQIEKLNKSPSNSNGAENFKRAWQTMKTFG
jgi:methyl-accepting chemotaxis protein